MADLSKFLVPLEEATPETPIEPANVDLPVLGPQDFLSGNTPPKADDNLAEIQAFIPVLSSDRLEGYRERAYVDPLIPANVALQFDTDRNRLRSTYGAGDVPDNELQAYFKKYVPTIGAGISPAFYPKLEQKYGKRKAQDLVLGFDVLPQEEGVKISSEIFAEEKEPGLRRLIGADKLAQLSPEGRNALRSIIYQAGEKGLSEFNAIKYIKETPVESLDPKKVIELFSKTKMFRQQMGASRRKWTNEQLLAMKPAQPVQPALPPITGPELVAAGPNQALEQPIQSTPFSETRVLDAAKAGLEQTLTSQLAQAAEKSLAGTDFLRPDKFTPRNFAEKAIVTALSFADPLPIGALSKVVKLPVIAKPAFEGLKKIVGSVMAKPIAQAAQKATGAELLGVSEGSAKLALAEINKRLIADETKAALKTGALVGGLASVARQVNKEGEISAPQLGVDIALGAGLGVVGDKAVKGVSKGIGKLVTWRPKFTKAVELADGSELKPELLDEAVEVARKRIGLLVQDKPELGKNEINELATYAFHEHLKNKGVKVALTPGSMGDVFSRSLLNKTTLASIDDKTLGTRLTDNTINLIGASNKAINDKLALKNEAGQFIKQLDQLGYSRADQIRMLMHTESLPNGNIQFNPNGAQISSNFFREAYEGPAVTPEAQQALNGLRQWFDKTWDINKQYSPDLGRLTGYVPIKSKAEKSQEPVKRIIQSLDSVGSPGLAKHRTAEFFDPEKHVDDLGVLVDSYANQTAFHSNFAPIIQDIQQELTKLNLLGQTKKAAFWGNHFARVLGMGGSKDLVKLTSNNIIEGNRNVLQEFLQEQTQDPSKIDSAFRTMKNLAVNNLLFSSPRIYIQQLTQPDFMGTAEIGRPWIRRGFQLARRAGSEASKAADEMMDLMTVKDPRFVFESETLDLSNKFVRGAVKASDILAAPVKYVNNKRDIYNRKVSFIGAYEQFKAARNPLDVLDGLTSGEQTYITRVLQKEGVEAAARAYGVTRSRRINFAYGLADAPEFFAGELGRYIPFTTWGRSVLSRFAEDVSEGNFEQLSKRILDPLMLATQFSLMSGLSIQGTDPVNAAVSTFTTNLLPVSSIAQGQSPIRSAATTFAPGGKLIDTSIKLATEPKKKAQKVLLKQFALKKLPKKHPLQPLRKAIQKEFNVE